MEKNQKQIYLDFFHYIYHLQLTFSYKYYKKENSLMQEFFVQIFIFIKYLKKIDNYDRIQTAMRRFYKKSTIKANITYIMLI